MSTKDPAADLTARWLPTAAAVRHARALLDAEPLADCPVSGIVSAESCGSTRS
jgi:hypothetical protein